MPHRKTSRSWDPVAGWYAGWVGPDGSEHHRRLAVPALLDLLRAAPGERILDVGCGPGVPAPHVAAAGARYTGVDASRRLVDVARRHHGAHGRFLVGDATRLDAVSGWTDEPFDAAFFLLSLQDIDPLADALRAVAACLREGGRLVAVMTHPCFRVPRQSGWGWDAGRRLQFRRVDTYLTPLAVPMKAYGAGRAGTTRSYHRPLEAYVNGLAEHGLLVDAVREIPASATAPPSLPRAERRARAEIPLFLALRAVKR